MTMTGVKRILSVMRFSCSHISCLVVLLLSFGTPEGQFNTFVPSSQVSALYALFNGTQGENWQWKSDSLYGPQWNFTQNTNGSMIHNPCSTQNSYWQGVTCSKSPQSCRNETCQIYGLELVEYNLIGRIPSEIAELIQLKELKLRGNGLTGSVPSSMGSLSLLELIDLSFNLLTGIFPAEIGNISSLVVIDMTQNFISGEIPPEIGSMELLQVLDFENNQLTGPIPSFLVNVTSLENIDLDFNHLTGQIPDLSELVKLRWLGIGTNQLTGTLPSSLCSILTMEVINLDFNFFTGSIPSEIGNLTNLEWFYGVNLDLSGTIPNSIGHLRSLQVLDLTLNAISGPLPIELCKLSHLGILELESNRITGTVPTEMSNLASLQWLDLSDNQFSGSLTKEIGNMTLLRLLNLRSNNFDGSIPSSISNVSLLKWFDMGANLLIGPIPESITKLNTMIRLGLYQNYLSGAIPAGLGNLTTLEWANIGDNSLSSSIPVSVGELTTLRMLNASFNHLTSLLPREIGKLASIEEIYFEVNQLRGAIPTELGDLPKLQRLFLDSNLFSGRIPSALGNLTSLHMLDLSNNRLTGKIPMELSLQSLVTLCLSVNCLEPDIPKQFCGMKSIEVISLNGLGGADSCDRDVEIPIINTKQLLRGQNAEIPECIWTIPNLNTLHLTGNGILGSISSKIRRSNITELSLSHNRLDGTIPKLSWGMEYLDLSYNRLVGHIAQLTTSVSSNISIVLKVNRLSGELATKTLETIESLDILKGNMFSCGSIPSNDDGRFGYDCGSELYDYSIFSFAGVVAAVLLLIGYVWHSTSCFSSLQHNSLETLKDKKLWTLCQQFHSYSCLLAVLVVLVILSSVPIYVLRINDSDHNFSSHWNVYSWVLSSVYTQGTTMGVLVVLVWAVALSVVLWYLWSQRSESLEDYPTFSSNSSHHTRDGKISVIAYVCNLILTVGVNVLYVYCVSELSLSPVVSICIRICMSVFRIISSISVLPLLSNQVKDPIRSVVFRFRLLLFNNLLVPCVVTALTSSNCFQEVFVPPDTISTTYSYRDCVSFYVTPDETFCYKYETFAKDTGSFVPTFSYNYQCTSVLLDAYIPVLIIGYCLQIILPLLFIPLLITRVNFDDVPIFHRKLLHGLLWPEYFFGNKTNRKNSELLRLPSVICCDMLSPLATLLTFGLCSPVLALSVAVFGLVKLQIWIWTLIRFCSYGRQQHQEGQIEGDKEVRDSNSSDYEAVVAQLSACCLPMQQIVSAASRWIALYSLVFVVLIYLDVSMAENLGATLAVVIFALSLFAVFFVSSLRVSKSTLLKRKEVELGQNVSNPMTDPM